MFSSKTILIVGGSGYVGTHLALKLRERYKVFATYHTQPIRTPGVTFIPMEASSKEWVKRVVYTANPEIIIYVAGSNSAEWAEANSREVEQVHTGGPATVSNVSEILQSKFIFLSNGYVFDGSSGNYKEPDTTVPLNALGKAKAGGENYIRGKSLNYVIVRSSPVYGMGNGLRLSFLDHLRMKLSKGEKVEVSHLEWHAFAPVSGLVDLLLRLIESGLRNEILHYGGLTKLTLYEFAKHFAKRFMGDSSLIFPQKTSIHTSFDYSLNSSQAIRTLKIKPLLLEEGFDLFEQELISSS